MIVFAAILDIESARPLASADQSGTITANSAMGTELLFAAHKVCTETGVVASRQLAVRTVGSTRLYSLCYGTQGYFAATPAARTSSAYAALLLLADLAARWEMGDAADMSGGMMGRRTPMDDSALLARLVHFSAVRVAAADMAFAEADCMAATGLVPAASVRSPSPRNPTGGWSGADVVASSRQAAAELRAARQLDSSALAAKGARGPSAPRPPPCPRAGPRVPQSPDPKS